MGFLVEDDVFGILKKILVINNGFEFGILVKVVLFIEL